MDADLERIAGDILKDFKRVCVPTDQTFKHFVFKEVRWRRDDGDLTEEDAIELYSFLIQGGPNAEL